MLVTVAPTVAAPAASAASASSVAVAAPSCAAIVVACGFILALRVFSRDLRQIETRLRDEREEAERRLREEYAQLRERHGRDLLVEQIRRVGDLYAEYLAAEETGALSRREIALHRLRVHLPAVPGRYCSLLKLRFDIGQSSESEREASRRFARHDRLPSPELASPEWICQEFAENLRDLMEVTGPPVPEPRRPSQALIGDLLRLVGRRRAPHTKPVQEPGHTA